MRHMILAYSQGCAPEGGIILGPNAQKNLGDISKARKLQSQLGTRCAAGYLRNRGWTLEAAIWILLRKETRDHRLAA